jgi:hypothetical protein
MAKRLGHVILLLSLAFSVAIAFMFRPFASASDFPAWAQWTIIGIPTVIGCAVAYVLGVFKG